MSEKTDGGRRGGDVAYEGVVEEYALDNALSSFFELQERNQSLTEERGKTIANLGSELELEELRVVYHYN